MEILLGALPLISKVSLKRGMLAAELEVNLFSDAMIGLNMENPEHLALSMAISAHVDYMKEKIREINVLAKECERGESR